jgi:hypothetical protein
MYWWALLIILWIFAFTAILVTLYRVNKIVSMGNRTIHYIGNSLMMPFMSLATIFWDMFKKPTKAK